MHRHVFICGLHRSGTTLLQRALGEHPDISSFRGTGAPEDEGQHLQTIYMPARAYGGPGKFAFSPDAHLTEHSPLVNATNQALLFDQWKKYWDVSKPLLLEKSPPNIIRSRFLQAMFPNSAFIFITRHPIAVSFATQKWAHSEVPRLMEHWQRAYDIMEDDKTYLREYISLRYEDWITHPEQGLKQVCEFLKIPTYTSTEIISDNFNQDYFLRWNDYRISQPENYRLCLSFEKSANRFGYTLEEPYTLPL